MYISRLSVVYFINSSSRHDLLKGRGEYSVQIGHFIETLRKKPGAIRRSLALAQCPDGIIAAYKGKFDGDPLGFLDYIQKAGAGGEARAFETAEDAARAQIRMIGDSITVR